MWPTIFAIIAALVVAYLAVFLIIREIISFSYDCCTTQDISDWRENQTFYLLWGPIAICVAYRWLKNRLSKNAALV